MSKAVNPKFLKVLVALRHAGRPLQTAELQRFTALPIAAINKFLYQCREGFVLQLVRRVELSSGFADEFINTSASVNEYLSMLEKAETSEDRELASLKGFDVSVEVEEPDVKHDSEFLEPKVKAKKESVSHGKAQKDLEAEKTVRSASKEMKLVEEDASSDDVEYVLSRDNVIRAFKNKTMTMQKLLNALNLSTDKEGMVQSLLDPMIEDGTLKTKKVMNSIAFRPNSSIFEDYGPLEVVPKRKKSNENSSSLDSEPAIQVQQKHTQESLASENTKTEHVDDSGLGRVELTDVESRVLSVFSDSPLTNKDVIGFISDIPSVKVTRTLNLLSSKALLIKDTSVKPSRFILPEASIESTAKESNSSKNRSTYIGEIHSKKIEDAAKENVVVEMNSSSKKTAKPAFDFDDKELPALLRYLADRIEAINNENNELKKTTAKKKTAH